MRVLDATFLAEARALRSPLIYFIEFATPSQSGGTLTRESSGLVDLVDFSTLPNLDDFTILAGNWSLTAGELLATYPTLSRSLIRYDNVAAAHGLVVQFRSTRPSNNPVDPDVDRSGFTAAAHGIDDSNAVFMGVSPAGTANTDVPTIWQGDSPVTVLAGGLSGGAGTTYHGINYFGSGPALHYGTTGGVTTLQAAVANVPADGPAGLAVYWDMLGEQRQEDAAFQELRYMSNPWIRVYGLPTGWSAEAVNAAFGLTGSAISTGAVGIPGVGLVPLTWRGAPFSTIRVRNASGALVGAQVNDGAINYGDVYKYTPPQPTPILNLCTADVALDWDSKTWTGLGRENVSFDGVSETGDFKGQGVNLEFSAVDLDAVLNLIRDTRHRGGIVRIWAAHYDEATGSVAGTAEMIFSGLSQGGFEYEETRPEDPREPGTATLSCRVASTLAELQQTRGIRTNNAVWQRFYPGETGAQNVPKIEGQQIFWGRNPPNAWVNQHRS